MSPFRKIYRWIIFKVGDTKWLGWRWFPFIATWSPPNKPKVTGEELDHLFSIIKKGDVLLLRHDGFASNVGIPGAMIHAVVYVGDKMCIEALSDDEGGVVKRHIFDSLREVDRLIVVRPPEEYADLIDLSKELLGLKYDIYFDFNIEEERKSIKQGHRTAKICCTEVPYYCYYDKKEELGLYKVPNTGLLQSILRFLGQAVGKNVLVADDIAGASGMKVVWISRSCTPAWFSKNTNNERLLFKVIDYWQKLR